MVSYTGYLYTCTSELLYSDVPVHQNCFIQMYLYIRIAYMCVVPSMSNIQYICKLTQWNTKLITRMAAFQGIHVLPAKQRCVTTIVPRESDYHTDRHTHRDRRQTK